ncbi:MAG: hypothetical protein EBU05_04525 [Chitinophagia bacterium]|jgi:uncharacterized protein YdeI (YjbR/CyaY-like superfamily)|nr:hypothetical protein [Chitinophagia bacterium]
MNKEVDIYLAKAKKWQKEMLFLRDILLSFELEEEIKWGKPTYTFNKGIVVMIQAFKDHFDLGFFKGALLQDKAGILNKAGENTQAARQMRFTDIKEIEKRSKIIKSYIKEAITVENNGLKYIGESKAEPIQVVELQQIFKKDAALKKAFESLTPGRQRAYLIHFSGAKQSETRIARIHKQASKIMCGKGMNDCTCGLSKRMPNCDGSHNKLK